jgi:hypothetical protein
MIVNTSEEVISELNKLNIEFKNVEYSKLSSLVEPPIQSKWKGWCQNTTALKHTLDYCIDKLCLKCKIFIFHEGKLHKTILVVPQHTPSEYAKYLKELNSKFRWPKKFNYKNQSLVVNNETYKRKDLRFMNCIISQTEKQNQEEIDFYEKRFAAMSESYILPDGIYLMVASDTLVLRKDGMEPWIDVVGGKIPLFSKHFSTHVPILNSSSGIDYLDIPMPTFDDLRYVWGKETLNKELIEENWNIKKNMAVFRGSATGCGYTVNRNARLKAAWLSKKFPKLLDAGITAAKQKLKIDEKDRVGYIDLSSLQIELSNFIPFEKQSQYKYILHLDGNVAAYRLSKSMLLQSTIILQESGSRLWFQHLLEPYIHYIPVKKDLSNLIEIINWCKTHDKECQRIAENAKELALKILTEKSCFDYIAKTLWTARGL